MDPETTLTDIFRIFNALPRLEDPVDRRALQIEARESLLNLASWIDRGGTPPKILINGSCFERYPVDRR